jgi:hypothetical protein
VAPEDLSGDFHFSVVASPGNLPVIYQGFVNVIAADRYWASNTHVILFDNTGAREPPPARRPLCEESIRSVTKKGSGRIASICAS